MVERENERKNERKKERKSQNHEDKIYKYFITYTQTINLFFSNECVFFYHTASIYRSKTIYEKKI